MMFDILQYLGCFLLPLGTFLFVTAFIGWIGGLGCAAIVLAVIVYLLGREGNLAIQRERIEAENRAIQTGWTDEERKRLGSTNG